MHEKTTRRAFLGFAGALGATALLPHFLYAQTGGTDAITQRTIDRIRSFGDWLQDPAKGPVVKGFIGEVGWPNNDRSCIRNGQRVPADDADKWNALAERVYAECDRYRMWVTAHDANERQLHDGFYMSIYRGIGDGKTRPIVQVGEGPQYRVVEAHPSSGGVLRGLNIPTGQNINPDTFGTNNLGSFDQAVPGGYWYAGIDEYQGRNTFEYLYSRGIRLARLGLRWERIQPSLGGALDQTEISRYKAGVSAAGAAGVKVVLDVHNYAKYYKVAGQMPLQLGTPELSKDHFVDLWRRLSREFKSDKSVIAYDLMNEPANGEGVYPFVTNEPTGEPERRDGVNPYLDAPASRDAQSYAWEDMTTAVYSAIRENGDDTPIIIPLHGEHPEKWITQDTRHLYTQHVYFDTVELGSGGGHYEYHYDEENAYWASGGSQASSVPEESQVQPPRTGDSTGSTPTETRGSTPAEARSPRNARPNARAGEPAQPRSPRPTQSPQNARPNVRGRIA